MDQVIGRVELSDGGTQNLKYEAPFIGQPSTAAILPPVPKTRCQMEGHNYKAVISKSETTQHVSAPYTVVKYDHVLFCKVCGESKPLS